MMRAQSCLVGALLLGAVIGLPAQAIRGKVVEAVTGQPVSGAIVEVHDADGYLTKRVVTSATGGFLVPLSTSGRYRLTMRAIGYRPGTRAAIDVELAVRTIPDVALERQVYTLPDLVKFAGVSCVNEGTDREAFADLLAAFGAALTLVQQAIEHGEIEFETEIVDRTIRAATLQQRRANPAHTLDTIADTLRRPITYWPVHTLPVDSLKRFGFAVERWEGGQGSWTLYGPDPTVLFSPWFLETHCFSMDRPSATADSLILRYAPRRRSSVGDIAGELVVNASDLAPRQLRFRFAYLPEALAGVGPGSIGGVLDFDREPGGIWFVNRWRMWSPLLSGRRRVGGSELDGRVVSARPDR
jgi:hypothetical protein